MKMNIHQLAKASRRLRHIVPRIMKRLMHGRGKRQPDGSMKRVPLTNAEAAFERNRLAAAAQAAVLVTKEIKNRRIGQPGLRDARPLKKQRVLVPQPVIVTQEAIPATV